MEYQHLMFSKSLDNITKSFTRYILQLLQSTSNYVKDKTKIVSEIMRIEE